VRSITPARTAAALAVAVLLSAGIAGSADAAKGGGGTKGGGKPPKGGTTSTSTLTGASAVAAAYADVCPKVARYTDCAAVTRNITDFGGTGWVGYAHPADEAVDFNTYYTYSQASWSNVVAHEVGGHVDAWNELVAKVGAAQAWTDYYQLDTYAQPWVTARWSATQGSTRSFSTSQAKEAYLDCRGAVAHGYRGDYLYTWGIAAGTAQQTFCTGYTTVMDQALAN
jgi:hypothetical protein